MAWEDWGHQLLSYKGKQDGEHSHLLYHGMEKLKPTIVSLKDHFHIERAVTQIELAFPTKSFDLGMVQCPALVSLWEQGETHTSMFLFSMSIIRGGLYSSLLFGKKVHIHIQG
jgi:hypothetical protein